MKRKLNLQKLSDNIGRINNTVDYISFGGCGVFALYLAHALAKAKIKTEIKAMSSRYYDDEADNILKTANSLTELNNTYGIYLGHIAVVIEDEGAWVDSNGVFDSADDNGFCGAYGLKVFGTIPVEKLGVYVADAGCWNDHFDRSQMPLLHKLINKAVINSLDKVK